MSDSASDAYRPDNKPKGFGWWPHIEQINYVMRLWQRGDRDTWLVMRMYSEGLIDAGQAADAMGSPESAYQLSFPL